MSKQKYAELPWSIEETIENLKELKLAVQTRVLVTNLDGMGKTDVEEVAFDFGRATTALEKQIPYKPEPCHPYEGKCKCGAMFLDRTTGYCGNCGQKLDWEDKHE